MRVRHLVRTQTTDPANGQKVDTFTDNGKLWCWVEEKKPKEEPMYGARQHTVEADIHLRGYPTVADTDRFYDLYSERTLQVKGIRYDFGAGETVVEAYYVPSIQG